MSKPPRGLQPGDVLLVDGKTLLSWVIKKVTRDKYSHVAVVSTKDFSLRPQAVEAIGRGVTRTLLRKFDWARVKVVRFNPEFMDDAQRMHYMAMVESYVGRGYDYLLLLKLLFYIAIGKRDEWSIPGEHREDICSKVASIPFWHATHQRVVDDVPAENTVPADFDRSDKVTTIWEGLG